MAASEGPLQMAGSHAVPARPSKIGNAFEQGQSVRLDRRSCRAAVSRQLGTLSLSLRSLVDSQSEIAEGADAFDRSGPMNTVRFGVSTLSLSH